MGNSNKGHERAVDQESKRSNDEYADYINASRDPNSSQWFGAQGRNALRDETLQGFRQTGGYNPYSMGAMEGGGSSYGGDVDWNNSAMGDFGSARGTFEDFSKTGGVDATALRQRSTAQIPAFYDQFKQSAQRRANVQGGYSPGFDAQQAEIGRQAGREGFNASRQVEGDIAEMTQQGRMMGAQGLMGLGGMETQNNQFNTSGQFQANEGNANRRQGASQFDQGMDMERARFGEGQRQFGAEFGEGQRRFNASGMAGMYGMDNDNYYRNQDNYLRGIQGRSGNTQNLMQMRRKQGGGLGSVLSGLGGLGQGLLGLFGGGSGQNNEDDRLPPKRPGFEDPDPRKK